MIHRIWPEELSASANSSTQKVASAEYEEVYDKILGLKPTNEAQRTTQGPALKVIHDTAHMRWLLYSQRGSSIPIIFLVLMVAWLAITFGSFGLFAPRHARSLAVMLLGSLVVSSAVFLILELDYPFDGLMRISSQPMRNALAQIGG